MTVQALMRLCAELGIRLALKGDGSDRLVVDAPKGALTEPLRAELAAHKPDLIAILKTRDQASNRAQASARLSSVSENTTPPASYPTPAKPTLLIQQQSSTTYRSQQERINAEVRKLLSGNAYDANLVDAQDKGTRESVAAQLVAAFGSRDPEQHNFARRGFMNHGYFEDTTRQLRMAASAAERAAAAHRLGIVGDTKATSHLIGSLRDSAPEVRRASIESLGQMGDPTAISALNDLLLRETSSQVPEAVIHHAINSIAATEAKETGGAKKPAFHRVERPVEARPTEVESGKPTSPFSLFEQPEPVANLESVATPEVSRNNLNIAEEQLLNEEAALRRAAETLERKRLEAERARRLAEDEARQQAEKEAKLRSEIEARMRTEEEVRRRMAEEAARQKAAEETRMIAEQEARDRAQAEARIRAEEEARFRLEAETLRKAAEELAGKRAEAAAARIQAEEDARRRKQEEARLKAVAAEARARAEEEAQRQIEQEMRARVEAEIHRRADEEARRRAEEEALSRVAEGARLRAEAEARIRAEQEAKRQAEEVWVLGAGDANRRAEEERLRREAEERHLIEEARLREEQETLMQVAADLSRRRSELEQARKQAEVEAQLFAEAKERASVEEAARRQMEIERQIEEEKLAHARRLAEEQRAASKQARRQAEQEEQMLTELDSFRVKALEEARQRAEKEERIKAEIFALSQAEEEQRLRIEAEIKRRSEAETRLREQKARAEEDALKISEQIRLQAEEEARRRSEVEAALREEEAKLRAEQRASEEARRLAEETRRRAEDEMRLRAEVEVRLNEEKTRLQAEEEARRRAEEEAQRVAEQARRKAEEAAILRAEVEARLREEELRLQTEREARVKAEEQAQRLVEEARAKTEEEARRRAEAEALVKEEEARLRAEQQARIKAEEEAQRLVEEARAKSEEEARRRAEAEALVREEEASPIEGAWLEGYTDKPDEVDLMPIADHPEALYDHVATVEAENHDARAIEVVLEEKGIVSAEDDSGIPLEILKRLSSTEVSDREAALSDLVRIGGDDAFRFITRAFDDPAEEVRNAAARSLFDLEPDRAASFTRALREGTPDRRRKIGQALAGSGLASEAIGNLTGESREKTYDAFSLLFLMAKAAEVQPLLQAIEDYPSVEVRIAVVKLLALSGQPEIIPAFRRLAVRGSLPAEVRSAVMEAIYQISSQVRETAPSAA